MASILGLSTFHHDSPAAQEERFVRIKLEYEFSSRINCRRGMIQCFSLRHVLWLNL